MNRKKWNQHKAFNPLTFEPQHIQHCVNRSWLNPKRKSKSSQYQSFQVSPFSHLFIKCHQFCFCLHQPRDPSIQQPAVFVLFVIESFLTSLWHPSFYTHSIILPCSCLFSYSFPFSPFSSSFSPSKTPNSNPNFQFQFQSQNTELSEQEIFEQRNDRLTDR